MMRPPFSPPPGLARLATIALALLVCAAPGLRAADTLPLLSPVFGEHMVLQRGKPNTLRGWARPGEDIRVTLADQSARATAADDGRWSATIQPPPPGGPYELVIDGPGENDLRFRDILVGDVWLCGGQSNMEMGITQTRDAAAVIATADWPRLRLFRVEKTIAYAPAPVPSGSWQTCTPANLASGGWGGFSAVAYHFGRRLQAELGVPVGLVQSCVGGTPAESWTSPDALRPLQDFDRRLDELARLHAGGAPAYGNYIAHWYDEFDPGQKNYAWFQPGIDEQGWRPTALPEVFASLGVPETPAVAYLRKTLVLPDPIPAGPARLLLGRIERMDTVHLNGRWIGASSWVDNPRDYAIPDGVLRPGANTLVVRVLKTSPHGGFLSPPDQLKLVLGDGDGIPLAEGEWLARLAVDARPPHPLPVGYENWPVMPSVLHHGMIAPLAPLAVTGAIWYQGEANVGRAAQYRRLLPAMIADWRSTFGQGDFPFYIVGLAAYTARRDQPGDDAWAELREAQAFVARTVPNSGLAVAIDKGDADDIHPRDKREVGERLALQALAGHYGRKLVASGPVFRSAEPVADGSALRLRFDHAEGGLVVHGDKPGEFALSGEDMKWAWAEARLDGDTVLVSSPAVPRPRHVRYAWQANPRATLFNASGLPAVPFRSDGLLASSVP
jgi:sialate O-acetylesterase